MGRIEDLHNFKPIDEQIETSLVSIRKKIEKKQDLNKEEETIAKASYIAITGRPVPTGCKGCGIMFRILNNWLVGYYDKKPVKLKPVQKHKEEVLSDPNPSYKELLEEAKNRGFENEGKGRPKKSDLIEYLKQN